MNKINKEKLKKITNMGTHVRIETDGYIQYVPAEEFDEQTIND